MDCGMKYRCAISIILNKIKTGYSNEKHKMDQITGRFWRNVPYI